MLETLGLPGQVALVVAVVAAIRIRVPKLDGWYVVAVALAVSLLLMLGLDASPLPMWLRQGIVVFLYAVGGASVAQQAVRRAWPGKDTTTKGNSDARPAG